jgi:hypothetical protein
MTQDELKKLDKRIRSISDTLEQDTHFLKKIIRKQLPVVECQNRK